MAPMSQMVYWAREGGQRHWYRCAHFWFKSFICPLVNPLVLSSIPLHLLFSLSSSVPPSLSRCLPPSFLPSVCSFNRSFFHWSGHLFNHWTQCLVYIRHHNGVQDAKAKGTWSLLFRGPHNGQETERRSPLQYSMMRKNSGGGDSKGGGLSLHSLPPNSSNVIFRL